ncbi:MAG: N-glycosylase/DNA lyase [Thermoplasmatota archaeon]
MSGAEETREHLRSIYSELKSPIEERLGEFERIWKSRDGIPALKELLFCILTPQSKAELCWGAVEDMACTDVLLRGDYNQVLEAVGRVRFKYKKAGYLIEARDRFYTDGRSTLIEWIDGLGDPLTAREWFVKNIRGLGYKEASHFLRNIGLGNEIAILDRHILRNLVKCGVIESIPSSISGNRYLETEARMRRFSEKIDIPLSHLDLVFWYMANGNIFK